MGCDIHLCIEYQIYSDMWSDFGGIFNPGRNYLMFEAMAGVRGDEEKAVCKPKGLPDQTSLEVRRTTFLAIGEQENDEKTATMAQALEWAKHGRKLIKEGKIPVAVEHPDWHSHSWLTTQEFERALELYHKRDRESVQAQNKQYLTPFQKDVISQRKRTPKLNHPFKEDKAIIYHAIHDVMCRMDSNGIPVRIVFWFDN